MSILTLLVLEDDTVECEECYYESYPNHYIVPAHKHIHGKTTLGVCESCGASNLPEEAVR